MSLTPALIWLLLGLGLCLIEAIVPTAFIAFVMGISALVVALVAGFIPFNLQIVLWMGLSALLVLLSRRLFGQSKATRTLDDKEAETLTEIAAGQTGRVLYEGNSWAARCEDEELTIAPQQKVYVVGRKGTTLLVIPQTMMRLE